MKKKDAIITKVFLNMWFLTALELMVFHPAKDVHDKRVIRNVIASLRREVVNH